jgi:glycine hydroxymethyltransferase
VTTRGMKEQEMETIADLIDDTLVHRKEASTISRVNKLVHNLCSRFPLYPELH